MYVYTYIKYMMLIIIILCDKIQSNFTKDLMPFSKVNQFLYQMNYYSRQFQNNSFLNFQK